MPSGRCSEARFSSISDSTFNHQVTPGRCSEDNFASISDSTFNHEMPSGRCSEDNFSAISDVLSSKTRWRSRLSSFQMRTVL